VSLNLVQLFKALGGGWERTFPDAPKGSVGDSEVPKSPPALGLRQLK
jgi:hypothetical protein